MASRRRRGLHFWGPVVLLLIGGAYALASGNWCGEWTVTPPHLEASGWAQGPLRVGAARVPIHPPFPVVVAGYGGLGRPTAERAERPLEARALVLEAESVKVAWLELDVLTIPEHLVQRLRERVRGSGYGAVWVVASHTHSGMGGYDPRWLSELAGTGRFREDALAALIDAGSRALAAAEASPVPVTLAWGEQTFPERVASRDEGDAYDARFTRLVFLGVSGPVAELDVVASHPTLVPRTQPAVDPDYPGRVMDAADGGVRLLVQGAVGNASAPNTPTVDGYAALILDALSRTPVSPVEGAPLGFARVRAALPKPDSSRLVPGFARKAGDNFLCASAPRSAEVDALRIGPVVLLSLPGEPTFDAALPLEGAAKATRLVSVANGYLGYVDTPAHLAAAHGEAKKQYFGPELLEVLLEAATLAGQPLAH